MKNSTESKTARTETFMGVTFTVDPIQDMKETTKKLELGYITPKAFWMLTKAHFNNMTEAEKAAQYAELNA